MGEKCVLSMIIDKINKENAKQPANNKLTMQEVKGKAANDVLNMCRRFPSFPDLNLVIPVSGHMYEKQECVSNMAFVPDTYKDILNLDIEYENPIQFNDKNIRSIRKQLEIADRNHCIVFFEENGVHRAYGVAALSEVEKHLITVIRITGHLTWTAYIKEVPFFRYINGSLDCIKEKFDYDIFNEQFMTVFSGIPELEENREAFIKILKAISELHHGTSIVILDEDSYKTEIKRLTPPKVGHGVALKKEKEFKKMSDEEIQSTISQITRIDGGLIFNCNATCGAIGCIFDGRVPEIYNEGTSGRGSRFNSVTLYVNNCAALNSKCLAVISSDDGSIDIVNSEKTEPSEC